MPRNLVICLDGTAGQARGPGDSNSVRVWELLDHSDDTKQIAYYDPGSAPSPLGAHGPASPDGSRVQVVSSGARDCARISAMRTSG